MATLGAGPLSLWLALSVCAAGPFGVAEPSVVERLGNGLEVTILADAAMPVVATQVWYHVGSADEDAGSRGLAHLFEHLMFGRTASRDAREYAEYHHRHGGYENAYTTPDETVYLSEIAPQHHRGVLAREADRMAHLVLDQEALDNEKRIVTEELRLRIENNPLTRLFSEAQNALLRGHPYGHDTAGTKEDLAAADLASVRAFYAHWYRPGNAHVVVVGPVDPRRTLADVQDLFGGIEAAPVARSEVPPVLAHRFPDTLDLAEDIPPVEVSVAGFPLPQADSEDYWALLVMGQLLAGGTVDPLREHLVSRANKALEAGTESLLLRRGGALVFYAVNLPYRKKETAFRHIDEARAELSRLAWLDPSTVSAAKRALLRGEMQGAYLAEVRAGELGRARWWRGDARLALERARRIESVTEEQVAAAYRRYVGEAKPVRLHIRPEKIPLYVRLFGWVYPLVSR